MWAVTVAERAQFWWLQATKRTKRIIASPTSTIAGLPWVTDNKYRNMSLFMGISKIKFVLTGEFFIFI